MKGDFHVRFCERFGLKCPDLLDPLALIYLINNDITGCRIRCKMV